MHFDLESHQVVGVAGSIVVPQDDELCRRWSMLVEGQCEGLGPTKAAKKYGLTYARYFQLRNAFLEFGSEGLRSRKRGPKTNYRRTDEVVRQVIRHRFLDPDASPEVIAQKLQQAGFAISIRSVQRVIQQYGLQKKTP
jgi:hypothetical protein